MQPGVGNQARPRVEDDSVVVDLRSDQVAIDLIGAGLLRSYLPIDPTRAVERASPDAEPPFIAPLTRRDVRQRWQAFRLHWVGHLLSMIGDHLTFVALPLAAQRLTGSGLVVGLVVSAETLAAVLLGTMIGTVTDRRHPLTTMAVADVVRAVVLGGLALLDWQSSEPAALLIAVAFVLGVLRLFHDGAETAMVARLVPDQLDVRSNARLTLSENIGQTVGPLLAGATISVGLWLAFALDALSFLAGAAAVLSVARLLRRHRIQLVAGGPPSPSGPLLAEIRAAFARIRRHVVFRRAVVLSAITNVAALPLGAQFVSLADEELRLSAFAIGAMFAVAGIAGIAAAPFVERTSTIRGSAIVGGTAAMATGALVCGLWPTVATAIVAFLLGGVGFTYHVTHLAALRQRVVPEELQGRVALTIRMILWSALPVGALLGGWLTDAVSARAMWIAFGALGLAAALWATATGLARVRYD